MQKGTYHHFLKVLIQTSNRVTDASAGQYHPLSKMSEKYFLQDDNYIIFLATILEKVP